MNFIILVFLIAASSSDTTATTEHPLSKENRALEAENEKLMNLIHDAMRGKGHSRKDIVKKKDFLMQENARLMKELSEEIDGTELDIVESEDKAVLKKAQNKKNLQEENDMLSKENQKLMKMIEESLSHAKKGFTKDKETQFLIEENQKLLSQVQDEATERNEEIQDLEQSSPKKQSTVFTFFRGLFAFIGAGYLIYHIYALVTAHTHVGKFSKEMENSNFERDHLEV